MLVTMKQVAQVRAKVEKQSIALTALVDGYTIYGRPGYWRMVSNDIPSGTKAGGFVRSDDVKSVLDGYYSGVVPFAAARIQLAACVDELDFFKDIVS